MTIRGLLVWYLCGVASVGVAGASAYQVLERQHASGVALNGPQTAPPATPPPSLTAAAGPAPNVGTASAQQADAAPAAPGLAAATPPSSSLPPLRHHVAAASAGATASHSVSASVKKRSPGTMVASAHHAIREAKAHLPKLPAEPPRATTVAAPPPYPYYPVPGVAHYATAQAYYYPYYLYYQPY